MFLVGWFVHAMLQAKASAASDSNTLHSPWEWFGRAWQIVLARWFLSALAMQLWFEAPTIFGASFGVAMAVPITKATAGIFGYTADSLLDRLGAIFGIIKLEIPRPPASPALAAPTEHK